MGKTAAAAGKAAGTAVLRIVPLVLRILSVVLMGIQLFFLGREYWIQRAVLGPALQAVPDRNYPELLYLGLVLVTMAFGILSMLWMWSRRLVSGEEKAVRVDTGRGLTAFILFFLMAFGAARLAFLLPYAPEFYGGILNGAELYLTTSGSVSSILYGCSILGIGCCIGRKVLK